VSRLCALQRLAYRGWQNRGLEPYDEPIWSLRHGRKIRSRNGLSSVGCRDQQLKWRDFLPMTFGWYAASRLPRRPRLGFCVRYAEGIQDRLPSLAEEIVGLKPDVIVAAAVNAAVPAHAATSEIRHGTVWGTKAKPSVTSWPTALLSLWPRARQDARPFADEAFLSSTCLANNSGSLATFAVIPCASPLLSSLAAERGPRSFSKHTYASCCPL
jgi:hypothetical protein